MRDVINHIDKRTPTMMPVIHPLSGYHTSSAMAAEMQRSNVRIILDASRYQTEFSEIF